MNPRNLLILGVSLGLGVNLSGRSVAAAEIDARAIEAQIVDHHMQPFGTLVDPHYQNTSESDPGMIDGYGRVGDSAIWTGHYLAALSYHYAVSPESPVL